MKNKNQKKEIKIILWLIALIFIIGFYTHRIDFIVEASENDYSQNWRLPENPDKQNFTCKDRIFIKAMEICDQEQYCVNDLLAMAHTEDVTFDCEANGDFGASHGPFQIHLGYHNEITQEQARDPEFATEWTYNRLLHYGYPEYRSYAIMKHNGTPNTPKTLTYLKKVNDYVNN